MPNLQEAQSMKWLNSSSAYIIAEAGVNHDGQLDRAFSLVKIAKEAGADAVKFQLFDPYSISTSSAPLADYQAQNIGTKALTQQQMLAKLTLPPDDFVKLAEECGRIGIDFLCTPFDLQSLDFLVKNTKMRALKMASGEITNAPLLKAAAATNLPMILSTGMSDLTDIHNALAVLRSIIGEELSERVALLHCVSTYPAPASSVNLRAIDTMASTFGLPVGLSDHTLGIAVAIAAVARGCRIIEKHFTYDPAAQGPDHAASLSPDALKSLIAAAKEVTTALGSPEKICQPEEQNTQKIARKSIVAQRTIQRGEVFSEDNLTCKRPAPPGSITPIMYEQLLGKTSKASYEADQHIAPSELHP